MVPPVFEHAIQAHNMKDGTPKLFLKDNNLSSIKKLEPYSHWIQFDINKS
jgi:hypothetical protein